jgi:uncharacterized protein
MLTALLQFIHRLRDAAVPVSMVEALDAVASLRHLDLADRAQVEAALRATLVKRPEHRAAFSALFDAHFAVRGPAEAPEARSAVAGDARPVEDATEDLLAALLEALRQNDTRALDALARLAVQRLAGIGPEGSGSVQYYLYRVLRRLDLSTLLQRAMRHETDELTAFDRHLVREGQRRRLEEFRRQLAEGIQHRLAALKSPPEALAISRPTTIEDVDFLVASPAQLRLMRETLRPLARKLAARIAQRRRLRHRGRLDVRRTMRRSLSAGGVPLDPAFRRQTASRPDFFLLCDISGSVAEFARFTMSLLYAISEDFPRVRSFVFVDGIDEVTRLFTDRSRVLDAWQLLARSNVIIADGHSDYGAVFTRFWSMYGHADLGPRATVIITGDARNNYRASGLQTLRAIRERVRYLYWLNPEPRPRWDTTDSIMAAYAPLCHRVFEVRNLRQLAAFVDAIA